ncbi:MAG TPA: hypothetical protein VMF31_10495 [Solirubrobacterales bacterium]|nr:hypothetical protein [Solirubrobacterales bacterium]
MGNDQIAVVLCATDDHETVWVTREGTTRGQAQRAAADEIGCDFTEVRVTVGHMRQLRSAEARELLPWADPEHSYWGCEPDHSGAIKVWQCDHKPMPFIVPASTAKGSS